MKLLLTALACAAPGGGAEPADYASPGPYPVGSASFLLDDGARPLRVELWYPAEPGAAEEAEEGFPVEDFVPDPEDRARYAALLEAAPEGCPSTRAHSARAAAPAGAEPLPLVVFSHCYECARFSGFSIAERLASHGFLVAAPDHEGTTLFDSLDDTLMEIDAESLMLRAGDISLVLDALLGGWSEVPAGLAGLADPERVGVFGHSFGSVTTGVVLRDDGRPLAGMGLAAPMDYALLDSATMEEIDDPLMLVIAREDNSISELGNELMRSNFEEAIGPAWKLEVDDAGHWSFSDFCGLTEFLSPGCGEATRQTNPYERFTYLPVSEGLAIAGAYTTAFFAELLLGENGAVEATDGSFSGVDLEVR